MSGAAVAAPSSALVPAPIDNQAADDQLIKEGDYVVFDEHGDKKSLVAIKRNGRARVGKSMINTCDLIGARWGSSYTLSAGSTHLVAVTEHVPVSGPAVEEVAGDNRDLVDRNTSQALTADDIAAMKASGKDGGEIIEALCKGSTTFESKTEFAQEKYKRRKARKYLTRLTLRRPTGWNVCQVVFDKNPTAVWNLRPDSLALLLSLANVGAGARCLVLENCQGVVSGAAAERLGGVGALCCVGTGGKQAPLSMLNQMNLAAEAKACVSAVQLADLLAAAQRRAAEQQAPNGSVQQQQQEAPQQQQQEQQQQSQQDQQQQQQPGQDDVATSCAAAAAAAEAGNAMLSRGVAAPVVAAAAAVAEAEEQQQHKRQKLEQQEQASGDPQDTDMGEAAAAAGEGAGEGGAAAAAAATPAEPAAKQPRGGGVQHLWSPDRLDQLLSGGFSSCIIAAPRLQPLSILQQLLPLLEPSSPFVVFCPWVQPLAEAMAGLTASKAAVMLQLHESWMRPYQVLPGRTHPHMNLSTGGTGGYILSGITVTQQQQEEEGKTQQQGERQQQGGGRGRGRGRGSGRRR